MMQFIEFNKSNCDSCFKCLRVCPTKAISFNKEERKIINDICIKCGLCQAYCPQDALTIKSSLEAVKLAINSSKKVIATVAPSYMGSFKMDNPDQLVSGLKLLGFDYVEETSVGAEIVAKNYELLIKDNQLENIITSCCSSANYLIENDYPELIPNVLSVVSPMIAHGRYIKKEYGDDTFVVFIGPCLAKMAEAKEMNGAIDAVITFDELYQWFFNEKIQLCDLEADFFNRYGTVRGKTFPLGGSLDLYNDDGEKNTSYRFLRVDGIEKCRTVLNDLKKGVLKGYCLELNICDGSCMNGPEMPHNGRSRYEREQNMINYIRKSKAKDLSHKIEGNEIPTKRTFTSKKRIGEPINQEAIREILRQMNKYSKQDELNCGACGYKTCKEKAIAIYKGHSEVQNCIAYLQAKAESMHSIMIEHSPNAVCIINSELMIQEMNPTFNDIFNDMSVNLIGIPIYSLMKEDLFTEALSKHRSIKGRKVYIELVKKYFIVNIIYHPSEDMLLAFFTDITPMEKKKDELEKVKQETLQKTQEVIDKQMRVAQEIASLLGETTAETKMSLKSLNQLVMAEEGEY